MDLLPLDDCRWRDLDHRNWRGGKRSDWTPDAPFVPDQLAKLLEQTGDRFEPRENYWKRYKLDIGDAGQVKYTTRPLKN